MRGSGVGVRGMQELASGLGKGMAVFVSRVCSIAVASFAGKLMAWLVT